MSPFSISLSQVDRLASVVSKALGIQLFLGSSPAEFFRAHDRIVGHAQRPIPFMPAYWTSHDEPMFWALALRAGAVLGLAAARVPRAHSIGQSLADALASGVLYQADLVLGGRNWAAGKGPLLPAPGDSIYVGLADVAHGWREGGLPEALTRLVLLLALREAPTASLIWTLEEPMREAPSAISCLLEPQHTSVEEMFSGFFPPRGRNSTVCASWCGSNEVWDVLSRELAALDSGQQLSWLKLAESPRKSPRA